MPRNPARERLESGELALGVGMRISRDVSIAKAMKTAGFDFLFIDLEHGTMPLDVAAQMSVAALDAGISPLVRVPESDHRLAARALDGGALGIVMPHVDTAAEAREIVDRLRFPPDGRRSAGGAVVQTGYGQADGGTLAALNAVTLLTVMLESEDAIANADGIAAVDGVDVLMIGTGDLSTEMGLRGQPGHERIAAAYETVAAACRRHGKWLGMGGVGSPEVMGRYIDMGARMILAGNDVNLLVAAGARRCEELRAKL